MAIDHVRQRAGICADDAILPPFLDGDVFQNGIRSHRDSVHGVVSGHVRARSAFHHAHAEGYRIIFAQQPLIEIGGRPVAPILVAVGQKMLQQRRRQPVLRVIALQTLDHRHHHGPVEEGVLAETFFGAPPARVSSQVGIRRAHHQPAAVPGLFALENVACLVAFHAAGLANQLRVPRLAHADRLRELRGRDRRRPSPSAGSAQRQAVQALHVARAVYAEARHTGIGAQAEDLFVHCHQRDDVAHPLLNRQIRVLKWILILRGRGSPAPRRQQAQPRNQAHRVFHDDGSSRFLHQDGNPARTTCQQSGAGAPVVGSDADFACQLLPSLPTRVRNCRAI